MPEIAEPPTAAPVAPESASLPTGSITKSYAKIKARNEASSKPAEAKPADAGKVDTKLADTKPAKPAEQKPASALDTVLNEEKPPEAAAKPADDLAADQIPADAPAKPLREALRRREAEVHKLRSELEASGKKATASETPLKERITALEKERDDLRAENARARDAITAINVDFDPVNQEKFVDGRAKLVTRSVSRVKEYGGNHEAFAEALKMPEGKAQLDAMREALGDVDELARTKVLEDVSKIHALDEEHAELRKDPQQAWAKLQKDREAREAADMEQFAKAKQAVIEKVTRELPARSPFFREAPVDASDAREFNAKLKEDSDMALHFLGPDATREELVEAASKAARFDFVAETYLGYRKTSQAEIAQLREQLTKYEQADTGFIGGKESEAGYKSPVEKYREIKKARDAAATV